MQWYPNQAWPLQCRFCGEMTSTNNDAVYDHLLANGCTNCQVKFNKKAERILQLLERWDEMWRRE